MEAFVRKYMRILKFGMVGCINTAVDFLIFTALNEFVGLMPATAQGFSYVGGIMCSFILNRAFTFKDTENKNVAGESTRFVKFLVVNGISFAASIGLMSALTLGGLNEYIAKLFVTGVTMVINYLGYKFLVFNVRGD